LKIARGKVKEDEDFCCPVCDYRVKIPRDAARPKLEDLINWQSEIPQLPFQPDEEECLDNIVNTAQAFRDFMVPYTRPNPLLSTIDEIKMQRFWLRKIEGADILLAQETNFFRQELHRSVPIAPDPPPILEASLSTRKPRPTKQQKLMAQLGIDNPDDLPQHLKTKPYNATKRKAQEEGKSGVSGRPDLKTSGSSGSVSTPALHVNNTPVRQPLQTSHASGSIHNSQTINFRPPLTSDTFPSPNSHRHPSQPDSPLFYTAPSNLHISGGTSSLETIDSPFASGTLRDPPMTRVGLLDPSLFSPGIALDTFNEHHDEHRPEDRGQEDVPDDSYGNTSQSGGGNFDSMFADLTNQDEAADGPVGGADANDAAGDDPSLMFTTEE